MCNFNHFTSYIMPTQTESHIHIQGTIMQSIPNGYGESNIPLNHKRGKMNIYSETNNYTH